MQHNTTAPYFTAAEGGSAVLQAVAVAAGTLLLLMVLVCAVARLRRGRKEARAARGKRFTCMLRQNGVLSGTSLANTLVQPS